MNWYFASRMRHKEQISNIVKILESNGHSVSCDWSKFGSLKPYEKHEKECAHSAGKIGKAIYDDTNVFVLITDKEGTDMFIELGIAIGKKYQNKDIKIYSVGNFNNRSLMHHHPHIKRVGRLEDVFKIECPEILNQNQYKPFSF